MCSLDSHVKFFSYTQQSSSSERVVVVCIVVLYFIFLSQNQIRGGYKCMYVARNRSNTLNVDGLLVLLLLLLLLWLYGERVYVEIQKFYIPSRQVGKSKSAQFECSQTTG